MKILMLTAYFPPEIGSAAHLFFELSQSLSKKGHNVTVVTTFPRKHYVVQIPHRYKHKLFLIEKLGNVRIIRLFAFPASGKMFFTQGFGQFSIPVSLLLGALFSGKQDVILVFSPPLPLGLSGYILSRIKGIPFVVNIQDLHPQAVIDLGLLKNPLIIRVFREIERFVYSKANHLTVHSDGNRRYVMSMGASAEKSTVIHNWADIDEIKPSPRLNGFREDNGLGNKFVVSYAGIMSYSQGLDIIIQAANLLRDRDDILFVLVGDGVRKEQLVAQVREFGLENVKLLPFQPKERYPQVLSASDTCLITLMRQKVATPVVPGKLSSIMSSGRPVIASVPLDGDVPKIVEAAQCGLCVDAGKPELLAQAVLELFENPSLAEELGRNGRKYAEKHFSLATSTKKYEELFKEVCRGVTC